MFLNFVIHRIQLMMFLEYAAAFFLLAESLKDAVNVILTQLKDIQLAVAITRVYEGENGPVLKELLEDKVLPLAAQEGNRWLASWAFWMLHRRDMAVRALIVRPLPPLLPSLLFRNHRILILVLGVIVTGLHPPRNPPNPCGSPIQALPNRRPGPRGAILTAQTKDTTNPAWCIKNNTKNRMGLCGA